MTGHSLGAALATLFAFQVAAEDDDKIPKPVSLFSIAGPYVGDDSFAKAFSLLESLGKLRCCRLVNHKDLVTIMPKFSFKWDVSYDGSNTLDDEDDHEENDNATKKKEKNSKRQGNGKVKPHNFHRFKHVGVGIRLYKDKLTPMEIFYRRKLYSSPSTSGLVSTISDASTYWQKTVDEVVRGWDQLLITNLSWNPRSYFKWPWHSLREYNARLRRHHPILSAMELNDLYSQPKLVGELVPQF